MRALGVALVSIAAAWTINPFVSKFLDPYVFSILMYSGINVIMAVSLNVTNGLTGQFSMGHAGFMAVGAYTAAYLTSFLTPDLSPVLREGFFLLSLVAAGALSALFGYVVGLPSLRLRGDYLAIVTLGFGEIIRVTLLNLDFLGGARGMPSIPPLTSFAWMSTGVVVTLYVVWRLLNSHYGRQWLAVREDEIAAEAMGVPTTNAKIRAFMLASFFAGVGGALFGHYLQYLNPSIFDFNRSFEFIIMVVLGGMGSLSGSVIAAILLTVLREALRDLQAFTGVDLRMIIYSVLLIGLMLTRPHGLLGRHELIDFIPFWRRRVAN